jgi:putative transposase
VKYAWIEKQRDSYPLEALCECLGVSASGFASWRHGPRRQKRLTDAQLLVLIRAVHAEFKGAYGSPRVWRELKGRDVRVSRERVARLMRAHAIRARHKRRYKATTDSRHDLPVAPNLLDRNFSPACPDQVWTADITYIPTAEGWLYLAVVMDLYTRMIVGWSMGARMTRDLVLDALRMAYFRRRPKAGLMHHSDRGSQYASSDYQEALKRYGMIVSMSRKGNCWENAVSVKANARSALRRNYNAPMESFFNSMKNERTHSQRYLTREQARQDTFDYIERFYNRSRRHSALGYVSPAQHHAAWQNQQKMAA